MLAGSTSDGMLEMKFVQGISQIVGSCSLVIDRPRLPRYYESFLFFKMKDLDDDDYYTAFKDSKYSLHSLPVVILPSSTSLFKCSLKAV
jgi:hypothetical protein